MRSLEMLDVPLAWDRLLWWARRRLDVPDRLPFETLARTVEGDIRISPERHLRPVRVVTGTKRAGTVRPFIRMGVGDLLVYQALVDHLAPVIEEAIGSRESVLAFRQNLTGSENPYEGTPTWDDFILSARAHAAKSDCYVLRCDVSSYFLYVDVSELATRLLEVGAESSVVRDLREFLLTLEVLGVRGLPQGVPPSSPLGNFYLADIDATIAAAGFTHIRYMDDMWIFAETFGAARQAQDVLERRLYEDRLSLGGDKSLILRGQTVLEQTGTAKEGIEARKTALLGHFLGALGDYEVGVELDPAELDAAGVALAYDELWQQIESGAYPSDVRHRLTELYRQLEAIKDSRGVADVPSALLRFPDLTAIAARYAAAVAPKDKVGVNGCFVTLISPTRFHKELEMLHICRDALWFARSSPSALGDRFGEISATDPSPLVRARALLAWGRHSSPSEFGIADAYWASAEQTWRPYALVAIQAKQKPARDDRYANWASEGRFLARLGEAIREKPFKWRTL